MKRRGKVDDLLGFDEKKLNKLIEKSGYDQVFHSDDKDNHADMNQIKGRIETNMRQ